MKYFAWQKKRSGKSYKREKRKKERGEGGRRRWWRREMKGKKKVSIIKSLKIYRGF